MQQHFDWLREATVRHGGAVVKTIGDAVMAAYPDAAHAVAAALEMRAAAEHYNQGQPDRPVALKIGIHHGAAIAVTLNDELDYFGQTVNIAARVQAMADAQEICMTDEVIGYPGVRGTARGYPAAAGRADSGASASRIRLIPFAPRPRNSRDRHRPTWPMVSPVCSGYSRLCRGALDPRPGSDRLAPDLLP